MPLSAPRTPSGTPTPGQPHLGGAERVNAALQGLAEAAVGLLHALHLEGQAAQGHQARRRSGPALARALVPHPPVPPPRASCPPSPRSLHPRSHSARRRCAHSCPFPGRWGKNAKSPPPSRRGRGSSSVAPAPSPSHLGGPSPPPLFFSGPHLTLEGDELGIKASEREVGQVGAPGHGGEALGAQVHALGGAPPRPQGVMAVLRGLRLLLPRARAGVQRPRGQRLPERGEDGVAPSPRRGQAGGPGQL